MDVETFVSVRPGGYTVCRVEGLAKEFQSIGIDIHPQTAAPPNHPSVLENPIDQIRRVHTLAEIL